MKDIAQHRQHIDRIDDEILRLLNERAEHVRAVGEIKKKLQTPVWVPAREAAIYERLIKNNEGKLFPSSAIKPIFREIISASISLEENLKVAYLGPEGTYCQLAGIKHFGLSAQLVPASDISDIFYGVERERFKYGVVPIENSIEGIVSHTIDKFIDTSVHIVGEIYVTIKHNLLSRTGNKDNIRGIYSHPQALAQCRDYIYNNFKDIPIYETSSTAAAARQAHDDEHIAAIGSELCEMLYNLKIVDKAVQDSASNLTRFFIIGREKIAPTDKDKTSLMFSLSHTSGALYRALERFHKSGINMTKIESRPSKRKAWEYLFYVDIDGHESDEKIKNALAEFSDTFPMLKILGSYPKGVQHGN